MNSVEIRGTAYCHVTYIFRISITPCELDCCLFTSFSSILIIVAREKKNRKIVKILTLILDYCS